MLGDILEGREARELQLCKVNILPVVLLLQAQRGEQVHCFPGTYTTVYLYYPYSEASIPVISVTGLG